MQRMLKVMMKIKQNIEHFVYHVLFSACNLYLKKKKNLDDFSSLQALKCLKGLATV